jgi:glycolate oxidase iron-sulfur subunit
MQTRFTAARLSEPAIASSEAVIRKCVHCGFCTATCPTYVLLGDELDSPRGRIYLIKEMLEHEAQPTAEVVLHIDRCLSCLACMTTCPSGVNYMHLIDHARAYVEARYRRPRSERLLRWLLATVLPHPRRFRLALRLARLLRPLRSAFTGVLEPLQAMLALAPGRLPATRRHASQNVAAARGRVILMQGCAEPVLRPEIQAAALRVINRCGYEVSFARGEVCCGALVHHMGRQAQSLAAARANIDAWLREPPDAILITAAGCGTTVKDYGFMLRNEPAYAAKAARVAALARDIAEWLGAVAMPAVQPLQLRVAYHAACSLQHGQRITTLPQKLLSDAGFTVVEPAESHLCCGSAGTYNILQPRIAAQLAARKLENIMQCRPDVIATGNIGCATQIGLYTNVPVVHTIQLLDWASGGPRPF